MKSTPKLPVVSIALIGCASSKCERPAQVREFYTSQLFRATLTLAERRHDVVYVISAKYELVQLDQVIEPYDRTMAGIAKEWRVIWGIRVWDSILSRHQNVDSADLHLRWQGLREADPTRGLPPRDVPRTPREDAARPTPPVVEAAARRSEAHMTRQAPVLVHAWMSATEMTSACGLTLRRASTWTYSVYNAANEKLFSGTMPSIKTWLRKEGYVT